MSGAMLTPEAAVPFHAKRLLYVITGGVQAMFGPMWLQWFRTSYPELALRYAITRSAAQFTTMTALSVAAGEHRGAVDEWGEAPRDAPHVELAQWPDAILVHPATMNFVARFSLGLADTPVLLALQCTSSPIALCPALPPGGYANPAYRRHVTELSERDNVTVLPPVTGRSLSTGEIGVGTAAALPHAVAALEELRCWLEHPNG